MENKRINELVRVLIESKARPAKVLAALSCAVQLKLKRIPDKFNTDTELVGFNTVVTRTKDSQY